MGSYRSWWHGSPSWLKPSDIVQNISGRNDRICIIDGSKDMMMDARVYERQAADYRTALESQQDQKKIDVSSRQPQPTSGAPNESAAGVRLVVVDGAGHHLQNDVQRDVGAAALLDFV